MEKYSYLSNAELSVIVDYYNKFKENPESVDSGWKKFFEGYEFGSRELGVGSREQILHFVQNDKGDKLDYSAEFKVVNLITGYRQRGHLFTKTNPVRRRRQYSPTLDIENFGLTQQDLQKRFDAGSLIGIGNATLQEIVNHLETTYCRSIGVEYLYIRTPEILRWLQSKMEPSMNMPVFSAEKKLHILKKLNQAVIFEEFLHTKFVGQKTFSLQGAESLIPALDNIIISGSQLGIEEFVIGMAHRGRLNVLTNILEQPYEEIFSEFRELDYEDPDLLGDVKYHLGYSNNIKTPDNKEVHLTVVANPSHLEAVDPVTEGIARARIDKAYNKDYNKLAAILIHGDSSVAAQGVVYETLQLSQLEGYKTGGTIHIVINNQLGFTTNYLDARSSTYCTDVAKTVLSPVFHVNGDDPEALVYTIQLAMEFRQTFHRDIFIDILCYRRWGHNEADEPRFTQPLLYKIIEKHPNPRDIYIDELINQQVIDKEYADKLIKDFRKLLDDKLTEAKQVKKANITSFVDEEATGNRQQATGKTIQTLVSKEELMKVAKALTEPPAGYKFFDKALKILKTRKDMIEKGEGLDWALCELLAIGTLLYEGYPVRMSGQDTKRGTFSQRHSTLTIEDSEEEYFPLKHISPEQASFEIYNSPLSEYGVLGFEYGYALSSISHLVIWEAQFGDFDNVAQTIIDQYIVSAGEKWNLSDNLVLFLPHGYEAQGPDHSSARMERFLAECAVDNIIVANCTTPANLFHLLRRHKVNRIGKPLIIFTPKSLLRHPSCVSTVDELTNGEFKEVIDDSSLKSKEVSRVVLCTGKIYYDIYDEIKKNNINNTALVRIEQLYPFPIEQLQGIKNKYKKAKQWIWAQEEPENMGALQFIKKNIKSIPVNYVGRPEAGSTAPGSKNLFMLQQAKLMDRIFDRCSCDKDVFDCRMICAEKSVINSKL